MYYSVCFNFVKKYPSLNLLADLEVEFEPIVVVNMEIFAGRNPFKAITQE